MDRVGEIETRGFDEYPRTEMYIPKRIGSYLLDLAVSGFIVVMVFYFAGGDLEDPWTWLMIIGISGLTSILLKAILETGMGRSIGKAVFGLKVVSLDGEIGFGQIIARNVFAVIPVIGPFVDFIFGKGSAEDERQKLMDIQSGTLVVEDLAIPVEEPRVRVYREPVKMEPKEKVKLDFRSIRVGHCPRCGAPYRITPPNDTSFSGLWNHRCTWCNHLIAMDDNE